MIALIRTTASGGMAGGGGGSPPGWGNVDGARPIDDQPDASLAREMLSTLIVPVPLNWTRTATSSVPVTTNG